MACLAALGFGLAMPGFGLAMPGFGLAMPGFGLSGQPLSSTAAMGLHLVAIAAAAALSLSLGRRATRRLQPEVEARYDVRAWMRGTAPAPGGGGLNSLW